MESGFLGFLGMRNAFGLLKMSCKTGMNNTKDSKLKITKRRLHATTRSAIPLYTKVYDMISLRSFNEAQRYILLRQGKTPREDS